MGWSTFAESAETNVEICWHAYLEDYTLYRTASLIMGFIHN